MTKKINVTVISPKGGLSNYAVGTKVLFQKDIANQFDKLAIKAFIDGNEIGFVASSGNTVIPGCLSNREFHPEIKTDTIEGEIMSHTKVSFKNGVNRTALVVEVLINSKKISKLKTNVGGNSVKYVARVKGSTRAYPGKMNIMKVMEDTSKPTFVTLKKEAENLIVYYDGKPAGVVDERESQDTTDFNILIDVLAVLGQVTAKVTSLKATVYSVEFEVEADTLKEAKEGKKVVLFDDFKNDIVSKGICTADELQEVEDYLVKNGLPRKQIIEVFKSYKLYDEERTARIPQKPQTLFNDYFGAVRKNVVYINKGKHLRFIGEKGTGKNNLITTLAWVFKRPLYELSLNSQFDKTDLLGTKTIKHEVDEEGKEVMIIGFDKEAFVEAMEVGGFVNLDEVNTADPSVLVQLHSVADRRRSIQVAGYGRVVADDNFSIILTMNKEYQGTVSLNEATRDRFTPIKFPSNNSIEALLQAKYPMADGDYIRYCDQLYKGILGLVKDGELSMDCVTVRGFEDAMEVAEDLGLKESLIDNVANRIDDEDYCQHVLNMIDDIID